MSQDTRAAAPGDALVSGRQWDSAQKIAVLFAVYDDYAKIEWNGRDDLECPVCKNPTITYRRTGIVDMTAWCTTCRTGLKQGNGAA